MWVLFLIMLLPTGAEKATPLTGYTSYADCKQEEDRVQAEMYRVYPNDTKKFYLKCLIQAREVS